MGGGGEIQERSSERGVGRRGSFKAGGTDGIEKRDRGRLEYKKGIETRSRKQIRIEQKKIDLRMRRIEKLIGRKKVADVKRGNEEIRLVLRKGMNEQRSGKKKGWKSD